MRAWKKKVEPSSIKVKYIYTNEKDCLVKESFNWYQKYGCRIKHCIMNMSIIVKWSNVKSLHVRRWCQKKLMWYMCTLFNNKHLHKLIKKNISFEDLWQVIEFFLKSLLKLQESFKKTRCDFKNVKYFNFTHPCI